MFFYCFEEQTIILENDNQRETKDLFGYNFLKVFFVLKSKEIIKNMFDSFSFFFFLLKNTKKIKLREQKEFSNNIKMMFYMFFKIVLNNSFQKHKTNNFSLLLVKRF